MTTTIVTLIAAATTALSAVALIGRVASFTDNLASYGIPERWWSLLALLKISGALGLVAGLWLPELGVAAAAGLVLYFAGACLTVLRAGRVDHLLYPVVYLTPVAGAGILLATT